jgi:hypothetical protein
MTTPTEGSFEHINRIEEMRNRLAAGETTFTLDELKLTLAWADHLNYFRSLDTPRLTALEAENAALKAEVASFRSVCSRALSSLGRGGYLPDIGAPLTREMQKLVGETP